MKSAWHRPGLFFLVVAVCLATCIGCAEPSDDPPGASAAVAETPATAAGTPAMIFFTPEPEGADSVVEPQAPATGSETAAESPSSDSGTPAMIFFTATADPADSVQSTGSAGTPGVVPGSAAGTPGVVPAGGEDAPAAQVTRVALELTPSATVVARPSRATAAPMGTAGPQGAPVPDEGPSSSWPKGGAPVAGLLVAVTVALLAWYFFRRRG
jgi:hypothetical protein